MSRLSLIVCLAEISRRILFLVVNGAQRQAHAVVAGIVLVTVPLFIYTATHLSLDTDTSHMLDPSLPYRQLSQEFDQAFPALNDLIVAVIESDSAYVAEDLADRFSQALHRYPHLFQSIYQPGHGPFFDRHGFLYLDTDTLWTVYERLTEAEPFLGTLAHDPSLRGLFTALEQALDHELEPSQQNLLATLFDKIAQAIEDQLAHRPSKPFWREELFGDLQESDGIYRRFVLVKPYLDHTTLEVGGEPLHVMRALARDFSTQGQSPHRARIRLTGSVALANDELGSLPKSAGLATGLSFVLVCLILFWGLGTVRLVGVILITLLIGLAWTAAFTALAIGHLNVISVTFPVLFIGLGVDFGIQLGMRYREERESGLDHQTALTQAVLGVGGALTLAATAAAISFFSFIPTGYKGLAELGLIAGAGMYIALFLNLVFMPALLTLFPIHPSPRPRRDEIIWQAAVWLVGHRRLTLAFTGGMLLAVVFILPRVEFDFNPIHLKDPNLESVATFLDLLNDGQMSPYTASVLAPNLTQAQALAERLKALPEVDKVATLASFVPQNQEEKLAILEEMNLVLYPLTLASASLPPPTQLEQQEAFERFHRQLRHFAPSHLTAPLRRSKTHLLLALDRLTAAPTWPEPALQELQQRLLTDLRYNLTRLQRLLTAEPVTLEDLPQELRERYLAPDGRARVEIFPAEDLSDNHALRRFVSAIRAVAPRVTDTPILLLEGGRVVVRACIQATIFTLSSAMLVVVLALGRWRDAMLVFVPLFMAIVITLASTVILHVPLNLANIVAIPLLFGLGLAFGIYLVLRKRSGLDFVKLFHSSTPRAVIFSALTTMVSFGTLAFSSHRGTASIGILLTIALSSALFCTLVALPALLAELETRTNAA
ncbi:MAG: hypothetical protein D6704_08130 [Nitrospirae bacterium]|nr:MAG: hypothetical protein D6704_08130 [Nitrospirota bacterium]